VNRCPVLATLMHSGQHCRTGAWPPMDATFVSVGRRRRHQQTLTCVLGRLPDVWPSDGAIDVQSLVVRYRPELDPVLNGLSFSVRGARGSCAAHAYGTCFAHSNSCLIPCCFSALPTEHANPHL